MQDILAGRVHMPSQDKAAACLVVAFRKFQRHHHDHEVGKFDLKPLSKRLLHSTGVNIFSKNM